MGFGGDRLPFRMADFIDRTIIPRIRPGFKMKPKIMGPRGRFRRSSAIDQAEHFLREGVAAGRWRGRLPGERELAIELGIGRTTLRGALLRLEKDGVVAVGGKSSGRTITGAEPPPTSRRKSLRIGILLHPGSVSSLGPAKDELVAIMLALQGAGHVCLPVAQTVQVDKNRTGGLSRLVKSTVADAWIVQLGTVEVLAWFAERSLPVLTLGGRRTDAFAHVGSDHVPALREAVRRLVATGHRRIVFIGSHVSRLPTPGVRVRTFLAELEAAGIRHGTFNVPDWDDTPEGLATLLESLFRVTPPTALLLGTTMIAEGVVSFLAGKRLRVPEEVSFVVLDEGHSLRWALHGRLPACVVEPGYALAAQHILRWLEGVALGYPGRDQLSLPTRLVSGDTMGPAPEEV